MRNRYDPEDDNLMGNMDWKAKAGCVLFCAIPIIIVVCLLAITITVLMKCGG